MATKTKTGSTAAHQSNLIEKIGGQAIHLKEEIVAGTDHLLEAAGEKFAAVKKTIKNYVGTKKTVVKKPAKKSGTKSVAKAAKKVAAKLPLKKRTVKKAAKKIASVKKKKPATGKAIAKKVSAKISGKR